MPIVHVALRIEFSLLEICLIRLAGLATNHGVKPANAIQFAELPETPLSDTLEGWDACEIVGFTKEVGRLGQQRIKKRLTWCRPSRGSQ